MKKRLFSILTALALCLTLLPTAALADEPVATTTYLWQASGTIYTSTTEPTTPATATGTELAASGDYYPLTGATATTYKLMNDVTIDKPILVTGTVTLDLNGHVLKYYNSSGTKGSVIRVGNASAAPATTGSLTLTDSRATDSTATHKFRVDTSKKNLWILDDDGDETVTGGIITGGTGTSGSATSIGGSSTTTYGGGVYVDRGSTFTMSGGNIVGCSVSGGGGEGGGVYIYSGTFTMSGGNIIGCTVSNGTGGGVQAGYASASPSDTTTFTMSGGSIRSCTANDNGGGVQLGTSAKFTLSGNAKIENCTASNGGGVDCGMGRFTMSGGTITGCTATNSVSNSNGGGGVYVGQSATFAMSGGTIQNNSAANSNGGGVYVGGNCTLQGGTIQNNSAKSNGGGVFVKAGITLTVGGSTTTPPTPLKITGNTKGASPTTTDNICLSTKSSGRDPAKISVAPGNSTLTYTLTGSDLDLNSTSFNNNLENSGDGYAWNKDTNTLTLKNATFGDIKLKDADTTIKIEGTVTVDSIGDTSFAKTLTIQGENTNPTLTVNERIACTTNANPLNLQNITATVGYINWAHNTGSPNNLNLTNSTLTVNGSGDNGITAGQITLDDTSTLELKSGYISGNGDGVLSNVPGYCPTSGYTIGDPGGSGVTFYLLNSSGDKATNITLQKPAAPTTPPSAPSSSGPTYYRITVSEAVNGAVEANRKTATSGTTITVTVTPDSGYTLETLTVLDRNGNEIELTNNGDGTYSFKMPASKVTVEATFMEDNSMLNFFVDVTADQYYYDAVLWAAKNDITGGVDENHFGPDRSCTRAQAVTFLYRAALALGLDVSVGEDTNILSYNDAFDIPEYAIPAFQWAVGAGIVQGSNGNLNPNSGCTRAQIVTFLFRFAAAVGMDLSVGEDTNILSYNDVFDVPEYAIPAFQWAVGMGILQGNNGNLMSNQTCTRAQIVTMLYRLLGE